MTNVPCKSQGGPGDQGQGKRRDMGGYEYIVDDSRGHDSVVILKMYMPCRACLLNSFTYAFMHNPDFA